MDPNTPPQHSDAALDAVGVLTTTHIVLMVVLALAAILVICWGTVLARRRRRAEIEVEEHREIAEEAGATAPPPPSPPGGVAEDAPAPVSDAPVEKREAPAPAAAKAPFAEAVTVSAPPPAVDAASALTQLKGLGPKLAATLAGLGYTRIDQIAALTPEAASALDAQLGSFKGRMARDRWIEQAQLLATGDRAAYEAQFGKL